MFDAHAKMGAATSPSLYRSLNAYASVFDNKSNRLLLYTGSDFFKYFMQEQQ